MGGRKGGRKRIKRKKEGRKMGRRERGEGKKQRKNSRRKKCSFLRVKIIVFKKITLKGNIILFKILENLRSN